MLHSVAEGIWGPFRSVCDEVFLRTVLYNLQLVYNFVVLIYQYDTLL